MLRHKAKRSLGQNFLTAPTIVDDIVRAGTVVYGDTILEIGPGKGALTEKLLKAGATVYAVEKDDALAVYLADKFSEYITGGTLHLIHDDILDIESTLEVGNTYKLIANIPYNITGKIIRTFLERTKKPTTMVLMVQYEVAKRVTDAEQTLLSLSVQAYGTPKLLKRVPAGAFFPKPKVDSAIIVISSITDNFFTQNNITEKTFFDAIHAGFAHKRKKLSSNLSIVFSTISWADVFTELNIDTNTRSENVSLSVWAKIVQKITT